MILSASVKWASNFRAKACRAKVRSVLKNRDALWFGKKIDKAHSALCFFIKIAACSKEQIGLLAH
ncbi:hypothetical protein FHT78_002711 [Rhizobium sp. BK196]|nr:hypothetical protein [Rhizobium sp. BK196]